MKVQVDIELTDSQETTVARRILKECDLLVYPDKAGTYFYIDDIRNFSVKDKTLRRIKFDRLMRHSIEFVEDSEEHLEQLAASLEKALKLCRAKIETF